MQTVRKYGINYHILEPHYHNQNPVEGVIRELRRKWYCTMVQNRVPKKLWDYGIVWISEIHSMTHTSAENRLKGAIPLEQSLVIWLKFQNTLILASMTRFGIRTMLDYLQLNLEDG